MVKKRVNFSKSASIAVIVVVANIVVLYLGTTPTMPLMWSVGGMGAITFFGTLILANLLSRSRDLNKGEIRKAITASVLVVYFVLISFISCTDCDIADSKYAETIVSSFTAIVGILIAFYFGSRAVKDWKGKSTETTTTKSTTGGTPTKSTTTETTTTKSTPTEGAPTELDEE